MPLLLHYVEQEVCGPTRSTPGYSTRGWARSRPETRSPRDASRERVVRAWFAFVFRVVRVGNLIAMERANANGRCALSTLPKHRFTRASTHGAIGTKARIDSDALLESDGAT
ncbi:MAG: hypothetical protein AB7S61_04985 [Methanoregulaceae archaeon]